MLLVETAEVVLHGGVHQTWSQGAEVCAGHLGGIELQQHGKGSFRDRIAVPAPVAADRRARRDPDDLINSDASSHQGVQQDLVGPGVYVHDALQLIHRGIDEIANRAQDSGIENHKVEVGHLAE